MQLAVTSLVQFLQHVFFTGLSQLISISLFLEGEGGW